MLIRGQTLTRRANHLHIFNIARILGRAGKPAAGFLNQTQHAAERAEPATAANELADSQRRPCR
jgi:hypothetical protein